jgi:hypothetical protein
MDGLRFVPVLLSCSRVPLSGVRLASRPMTNPKAIRTHSRHQLTTMLTKQRHIVDIHPLIPLVS